MTNYNWEWNDQKHTYDLTGGTKCHTGNTEIYTEKRGDKELGTLYIGGWSNNAEVTANTHVIDLTGNEDRFYEIPKALDENSLGFMQYVNPCKGWLSLPFPDYGTPSNLKTREQWNGIVAEIRKILKKGTDVLVACTGGHGRSGLFIAIVASILHKGKNGWDNPVVTLRKIHCDKAVETLAQEQYVYKILGLELQPTRSYATFTTVSQKCPICGMASVYVQDFGMCMTCKNKYAQIAERKHDLTVEDIDNPLVHTCDEKENCIGIYTADVCGHTVHNMIVSDGLCENCAWKANQTTTQTDDGIRPETAFDESVGECAVCHRKSYFGKLYGVCYDCSEELKKSGHADFVHNSYTDGFRAVPHTCSEGGNCRGIIVADVCKHVVHNMDVVDGKCPECYPIGNTTEAK